MLAGAWERPKLERQVAANQMLQSSQECKVKVYGHQEHQEVESISWQVAALPTENQHHSRKLLNGWCSSHNATHASS